MKEILVGEHRSIVCLNAEHARKDRHDREAIVSALRAALPHGEKSLVGNKGYRRFLKTHGAHFAIDERKVEEDARYDGLWVLRTDTDFEPMVVALAYKHLWMVEALFRSMKSLLQTRPVYHRTDRCIRGHVFCSFLALVLRQELQQRLVAKRRSLEWADVVRSEIKGTIGKVFQACGVAIPPALRPA